MNETSLTACDELTWECVMERIAAFVILILASPIILLAAIATKISCPNGPVFYRQLRVGRNRRNRKPGVLFQRGTDRRAAPGDGQPFMMWKFRTMVPDAEAKTGPVWAAEGDPRITPLGKFFRKSRIDELPQLFNVLCGEMSLIGPRPERPHFVSQLSRKIPEYRERLRVAPGITGLAQVNREYDSDDNDVKKKVQYDMFYIKNRSLRMNLMILAKTIDVVIHRKGAR